jgi:hypothetical protein|tara:strand:+ start:335 stop:2611 length:2277 start_codon:yes stop_codon:yes gene_type:complete
MPRLSKKKKAEIVKNLFNKANSGNRAKWQRVQQRAYEFYLNEQLTVNEKHSLEEAGMPTFVINRITPVIEMMKYFVTANSPRWQAVGSEGSDVEVAAVHSDIADYCWYVSNGKSIYSQVIQDALTKGIGYFLVDVDPDMDRGMGEVVFKRVEPFDVYVDPTSRDFLFRDASYIIIKKDMPKEQVIRLFPEHQAKIKKASGSAEFSNTLSMRDIGSSDVILPDDMTGEAYKPSTAEEDEILDLYETYQKVKIAYRNVFLNVPPTEEELAVIRQEAQKQMAEIQKEAEVALKEKSLELEQAVEAGEMIEERAVLELEKFQKETEEALAQQQEMIESSITEQQSKIENHIITDAEFQKMLDSVEFKNNVVEAVKFYETRVKLCCSIGSDTVLYEYTLPCSEYPLVPFSYTWTGTPFSMSAVTPLVGKQQEINKSHQIMIHNANLSSNLRWLYEEGSVPEDEWEQYSSSPGALLKYRAGFTPPTPVQPLPLNNAFFTISEVGKTDMEYLSGIYSSMQGDTGVQHETYRGLLAADEYGTRRIKAWMETIVEPGLEHLGRVFKQMAQSTYTSQKVFRIVQPSALQEDRQVEINIPIYNDLGDAIGKWKDYSTASFDVRIIAGSTLPVNRWALLEEYFRWYQSGLIDDVAMLAETDVRGKENIMKRKSIYSQLKAQVEELEDVIADREGTIETLSRQVVQAGIRDQVRSAENEMDKETNLSKAQQKLLRDKMRSDYSTMSKQMDNEMKAAIKEERLRMRDSQKQS